MVHGDAQEDKVPSGHVFRQTNKRGNFRPARHAPGRPEIQKNPVSAVSRQCLGTALNRGTGDFRRPFAVIENDEPHFPEKVLRNGDRSSGPDSPRFCQEDGNQTKKKEECHAKTGDAPKKPGSPGGFLFQGRAQPYRVHFSFDGLSLPFGFRNRPQFSSINDTQGFVPKPTFYGKKDPSPDSCGGVRLFDLGSSIWA